MLNDMLDIKKQVGESSKIPFQSFRRPQTSNPQPPNVISNVESDQEKGEEETTLSANEFQEEEEEEMIEAHGLWDFILTTSENEEEEALPIETRSKRSIDSPSSSSKQRPVTPVSKDK